MTDSQVKVHPDRPPQVCDIDTAWADLRRFAQTAGVDLDMGVGEDGKEDKEDRAFMFKLARYIQRGIIEIDEEGEAVYRFRAKDPPVDAVRFAEPTGTQLIAMDNIKDGDYRRGVMRVVSAFSGVSSKKIVAKIRKRDYEVLETLVIFIVG